MKKKHGKVYNLDIYTRLNYSRYSPSHNDIKIFHSEMVRFHTRRNCIDINEYSCRYLNFRQIAYPEI